jgi:LysM repeat protein
MKRIGFLFLFFIVFQFSGFAQSQTKHKVVSGESFYSIAKKYGITEDAIYQLNPKSKGRLLQLNTVLLIPNSKTTKKLTDFHIVNAGDTYYSISKEYKMSIADLKKINPSLSEKNLKIGDKVFLKKQNKEIAQIESEPVVNSDDDVEESDDSGEITHVISKGETLYSISKKYQTSISQLEELNPRLSNKLKIGYKLIIKKGLSTTNTVASNSTNTNLDDELDVNEDVPYTIENVSTANQLIQIASQQIGTRYRSGGTSSGGFDCSGLMCYTFSQLDLKLPRSSNNQSQIGKKISKKKAQKGDLIFFSTNGRGTINHVGMITEVFDDEILFIHSSVQSGVIVSSTNETYYSKRFKTIKRVLP